MATRTMISAAFPPAGRPCDRIDGWRVTAARRRRSISRRSLDEIVRILDDANVVVHAFDGRIIRWSGGCAGLYGWSAREALGRNVRELLGTEFPQPLDEILGQLRRHGTWKGELTQRHRDGRAIFVVSRWVAVSRHAAADRVVLATHIHVSNLKYAQADLAPHGSRICSPFSRPRRKPWW